MTFDSTYWLHFNIRNVKPDTKLNLHKDDNSCQGLRICIAMLSLIDCKNHTKWQLLHSLTYVQLYSWLFFDDSNKNYFENINNDFRAICCYVVSNYWRGNCKQKRICRSVFQFLNHSNQHKVCMNFIISRKMRHEEGP